MSLVNTMDSEIGDQSRALVAEKEARITKASTDAQAEYTNLSTAYLTARRQQMGLDQQLVDESTKIKSDPNAIALIVKQKEVVDKSVDSMKKQFAKNGIDQPDAIIRPDG